MTLAPKPFAEFAAELAAGLTTGRGDEPLAESATLKIVELGPGTGVCASSSITRSR